VTTIAALRSGLAGKARVTVTAMSNADKASFAESTTAIRIKATFPAPTTAVKEVSKFQIKVA